MRMSFYINVAHISLQVFRALCVTLPSPVLFLRYSECVYVSRKVIFSQGVGCVSPNSHRQSSKNYCLSKSYHLAVANLYTIQSCI